MTILPTSASADAWSKVTATSPQVLTCQVPIATGASLSADFVDLQTSRLFAIWVPIGFSGSQLTFQSSPDGVTFGELNDDTGAAVSASITAGTFVIISAPSKWLGVRYLKVRSGTVSSPINQASAVVSTLISLP